MFFLHFLSREKKTKQKKAARVPLYPARRPTGRCSQHHAVRQGANRSEARSNRQIVSTRARLATPHGGMVRSFIARLGDAQGIAGHGRALLLRFLARDRK
jgi:hypothetical protein